MIRVTLDTGILPADDLFEAAAGRPIFFAAVSVTGRETRGTSFDVQLTPLGNVPETGVFGESEWGSAVFADAEAATVGLEDLIQVISSGSFPPPSDRDHLTESQRHQLRDAMILEAHAREGRDIFVSDDRRAFINHGRRARLATLTRSDIMSREEFSAWLRSPGTA